MSGTPDLVQLDGELEDAIEKSARDYKSFRSRVYDVLKDFSKAFPEHELILEEIGHRPTLRYVLKGNHVIVRDRVSSQFQITLDEYFTSRFGGPEDIYLSLRRLSGIVKRAREARDT